MSENKTKPTPLEIVERYHKRYLEYEKAFNKDPDNRINIQAKLEEVAKSGIDFDSEEFLNQMVDVLVEKPQKQADVNNAAFKFVLFTDFFLLTQDEELPEEILKDYDAIPIKDSIKPYFSVENGEFVKNEKQEVTPEMKKYFQDVIAQIKAQ